MHISTFIGGLSAICGLTLAQTTVTSPVIEADDFSVTGALEDLGVDVSQIPALESFTAIETRSTDKACAAAVSKLASHRAIIYSKSLLVRKFGIPFWLQGCCSRYYWVQQLH